MIKVCCVCRKSENKGQWLRETLSQHQGVSHVYCPSCFEGFMEDLDRFALKKGNKSVYTVIDTGTLLGA